MNYRHFAIDSLRNYHFREFPQILQIVQLSAQKLLSRARARMNIVKAI